MQTLCSSYAAAPPPRLRHTKMGTLEPFGGHFTVPGGDSRGGGGAGRGRRCPVARCQFRGVERLSTQCTSLGFRFGVGQERHVDGSQDDSDHTHRARACSSARVAGPEDPGLPHRCGDTRPVREARGGMGLGCTCPRPRHGLAAHAPWTRLRATHTARCPRCGADLGNFG